MALFLRKIFSYLWAMEKHLDHKGAWKDFWGWIKAQEKWKEIPRQGRYGKLYLYKTAANMEADGKDNHPIVGPRNIQNILNHHAPDRYDVDVVFKLKQ